MQQEIPELDIESVEVTTTPLKSWRDGIRMIPTIKSGNKTLSGIILTKSSISSFIEKYRTNS